MQTNITSRFQTTTARKVRKIVLTDFLRHQNSIRIGPGDIVRDIQDARTMRAGKYK